VAEIFLTQAEAAKGAKPSTTAGTTISSSEAIASLGRLISIARLPASESSDRRLVLDQSSSTSPWRGSMNRLITYQRIYSSRT
jgi:hypothetical protein